MNPQPETGKRVCIVTPCYNDGHLLPDAIASIRACVPALYEHIIVNDGSTDPDTLNYLERLRSEGTCVIDQPNSGPSAARNTAIRATRCDLILPVDADNRILPTLLEKAIALLDSEPECSVVYSDVRMFGEVSGEQSVPEPCLARLLRANYIDTCAVFRKSLWQAVGGYEEDRRCGWEDWDFWLKAMCLGHQFRHIPEILYEYRVKAGSRSLSFVDGQENVVSSGFLRTRNYAVQYEVLCGLADHWQWVRQSARQQPLHFAFAIARAFVRGLFEKMTRK